MIIKLCKSEGEGLEALQQVHDGVLMRDQKEDPGLLMSGG